MSKNFDRKRLKLSLTRQKQLVQTDTTEICNDDITQCQPSRSEHDKTHCLNRSTFIVPDEAQPHNKPTSGLQQSESQNEQVSSILQLTKSENVRASECRTELSSPKEYNTNTDKTKESQPVIFFGKHENSSQEDILLHEELDDHAKDQSQPLVQSSTSRLGLINIGNTCFANSMLQVLRFTPGFLQFLHSLDTISQVLRMQLQQKRELNITKAAANEEHTQDSSNADENAGWKVVTIIHKLYKEIQRCEETGNASAAPRNKEITKSLEDLFDSMRPSFIIGQQCDAHEFFLWLLKSLSEEAMLLQKLLKATTTKERDDKGQITYKKKRRKQLWQNGIYRKRQKSKVIKQKKDKADTIGNTETNLPLLDYGNRDVEFVLLHNLCVTDTKSQCGQNASLDTEHLAGIFGGVVKHTLRCYECETVWDSLEEYVDLELPLNCISSDEFWDSDNEGSGTLKPSEFNINLVEQSFLCGDNKYWCETCIHPTEAKQDTKIVSVPRILVLRMQISSVSYKTFQVVQQGSAIVPLSASCCSQSGQNHHFQLFAVVIHIGCSPTSGHYFSLVKPSVTQQGVITHTKCASSCDKQFHTNLFNKLITSVHFSPEEENLRSRCCCSDRIQYDDDTWLCFDDDKVSILTDAEVSDFCTNGILKIKETTIKAAKPYLMFYACQG